MNDVDNLICSRLSNILKELEDSLDSDILVYYGPLEDNIVQPFVEIVEDLASDSEKRDKLSIILTTNGGSAVAVERMVNVIRHHYEIIDFYVPDYAYSAGTIFCMSGDNIHMTYSSVLGPIDPQVKNKEGRWVPALGYLDKIEELLGKGNSMSQAEFLLLKEFDLAEIRLYETARDLTTTLLKKWLVKYKFKTWTRSSEHKPVTDEKKTQRAEEIAIALGDNKRWLSHARPIGIEQLRELKLFIEDYSENKNLEKQLNYYHRVLSDYIFKSRITTYIHTRREGTA